MKNKNVETAYEHGLSKVKANNLEQKGCEFVKIYFTELKTLFPNRRLNTTEQNLVEKYQICL